MRYATYKEFLNNVGLYIGIPRKYAYWFIDFDDPEGNIYKFTNDGNRLFPPHAKTLKELFNIHVIWYDESNELV